MANNFGDSKGMLACYALTSDLKHPLVYRVIRMNHVHCKTITLPLALLQLQNFKTVIFREIAFSQHFLENWKQN